MSQGSKPYNILLSVRSPILAPLYLAKIRGRAFRNIEFRYGFEFDEPTGDTKLRDPLARLVLSKASEARQFIAGVADPFRCLINTDSSMYWPKILGGIIQHQTFWLASDDPRLQERRGLDAIKMCDCVISQPRYTSSYAVVSTCLKAFGHTDPARLENYDQYEASANCRPKIVYCNTKPGFERSHYDHFLRKYSGKFAYLTTDPSDHEEPLFRFASNKRNVSDELKNMFRHSLMTALFAGNGWCVRHPMLFDDIRADLQDSIRALVNDPIRAAVELQAYSSVSNDPFMSFTPAAIRHHRLVEIIEDFIRDKIYSTDLKIYKAQVRNGAALRADWARENEEGQPAYTFARMEDKFFNDYFAIQALNREADSPPESDDDCPSIDQDQTEGFPEHVRYRLQNYRQFVEMIIETDRPTTAGIAAGGTLRSKGIAWRHLCLIASLSFMGIPLILYYLVRKYPAAFPLSAPSRAHNFRILEILLCILSLLFLLFESLRMEGTLRTRTVFYQAFFPTVITINLIVIFWAATANAGWLKEHGDLSTLRQFDASIVIIVFGAFMVAARSKLGEFWATNVRRLAEQRMKKLATKSRLPEMPENG